MTEQHQDSRSCRSCNIYDSILSSGAQGSAHVTFTIARSLRHSPEPSNKANEPSSEPFDNKPPLTCPLSNPVTSPFPPSIPCQDTTAPLQTKATPQPVRRTCNSIPLTMPSPSRAMQHHHKQHMAMAAPRQVSHPASAPVLEVLA